VTDGWYRFAADENWPRMKPEHIVTEKDKLLARLVCNICRRRVSKQEKQESLKELREIHMGEWIKRREIAHKIAKKTEMSYRWVMTDLPNNYRTLTLTAMNLR
jgi:hypothetical protein